MTMQQTIEEKITASLAPVHLQVVNESYKHNVPAGSESHFKLVIVCGGFEGKSLLQRHQAVNAILQEELKRHIHALSMETLTAGEWEERNGRTASTPPCLGGGKADT
ncbi:MAG: BolA/IbaG family iron-sulfur metabolism protein [Proteobacteria bacterium]|nr:BolA/IbaG family iron-sulfur metabolism protein [Pseudomonadota bacterium]MCH8214792.1 BolA/IbaG family iron-sulfur metabolism protein [Pseudomonadota bacterium]